VLAATAGTAALVAAGCDQLSTGPTDTTSSGAVPTTEPAVDADGELTDQVTLALAEAAAVAGATAAGFAALAPAGEEFLRLHEAHGRLLGGLPDVGEPDVPGRRKRARRALLTTESRLQQELVDASMNAGSGALAQTFAAMAAAVAQLHTVWSGS
jgi:hypothetical protein